jgi:hypothetical protein
MCQELEAPLHSVINTLAYPKAALFGFCVALVAYNVLAVVKAALRIVHGEETIDNEVSGYYLAGNIARTYEGMMITVGAKQRVIFHTMPLGPIRRGSASTGGQREVVQIRLFRNRLVLSPTGS